MRESRKFTLELNCTCSHARCGGGRSTADKSVSARHEVIKNPGKEHHRCPSELPCSYTGELWCCVVAASHAVSHETAHRSGLTAAAGGGGGGQGCVAAPCLRLSTASRSSRASVRRRSRSQTFLCIFTSPGRET